MTETSTPVTIHPLYDHLLIKRLEAETQSPGGIIIPDNAKEKPVEDGTRRPLEISPGDRVLFAKYSGTEVKVMLDGGEHLILREDDVLAVLE